MTDSIGMAHSPSHRRHCIRRRSTFVYAGSAISSSAPPQCGHFHPRVKAVTLLGSFRSFTFRLWDEQQRKLVGYGHLRTLRKSDGSY